MGLSNDLLSQFAKITNDKTNAKKESTTYGTAKVVGGVTYVQLDGSDLLTPYSSTSDVKDGDRVQVTIKNHNATITGNLSSPSARTDDVKEIDNKVTSHGNTITSINNSVKEIDNNITSINNNITEIGNTIDSQGNQIMQINNVVTSQGNTINSLNNTVDAQGNTITEIGDTVNSQGNTIKSISNTIDAQGNQITQINNVVTSQGNTINSLNNTVDAQGNQITAINNAIESQGNQITAINNDIGIYNSSFQIANGIVTGIKGVDTEWIKTEDLEADHAAIASLDNKYANIDFTNIGKAAMEYFYANSGLIKDVVVGDQKITGHLIGVTISGDLIEGNTIVAEKLVIKGDDGLYYKLNTDGIKTEAEQTDYNSINGTIIKAKSITATKIAVEDLVAFGATIGGFVITDNSIHSGVKESVDNTTKGIYLDNQGQIAFGDGTNFVKYYKDAEGNYRLAISAESIDVGTTSKTDIGTAIDNIQEKANSAIISSIEQFYKSDSPTSLSGGSWSIVEPVWEDGKYLWRRTKNTYGDGHSDYTPSENGVCITGNTGPRGLQGLQGPKGDRGIPGEAGKTGPQGPQGVKGDPGEAGKNGKTSYFHIKYSSDPNPTTASQMTETPSTYIGTYVDFTETDSTNPLDYTWSRFEGVQGAKGDRGIPGTNGTNGKTSYLHIAYANSADGKTGFDVSTSTNKLYIGQYTDFTSEDSTDPTKYSWTKIKGDTGKDGTSSYTHIRYSVNSNGNPMVTTPTDSALYIGIYTGTSSTAPTSYTSYTWSRYTGKDGTNGKNGKDGNGINSISYFYAVTSTQNAPSASNITSTSIPVLSPTNKYLWQKEVIDFTDSSVADKTSVILLAVYGDKGTSITITNSSITYQASTSGTETPTGTWTTSIPSISEGSYLWTKTVVTYSDGNSTTSYSVAYKGKNGATGPQGPKGDTGPKGPQGATGAEGKGIASVIPEYYLSSSKTTQAGGSWSTTPPTWASGKYLWVRQIVTYTDSSVSRTQPYCDTSWEAVNDVQIGGRNLLLYSEDLTKWKKEHGVSVVKDSDGWFKVVDSSHTSTTWGIYFEVLEYEQNTDYTISVDAKYGNTKIGMGYGFDSWGTDYKEIDSGSKRLKTTFNTGSNTKKIRVYLFIRKTSANQYGYFKLPKLEKGNKATDWTPAPEDTETSINTAQSTADTAKKNAATAQTAANNAQSTADTAKKNAATAQSTADTAKKNAATAQSTADTAKKNAATAQSTADTARTEAADAAKTATNYLHYDSNGLTVSGETFATGGNPSGKNIRINSNGVNIRNGATVLASYGESTTIGSTSGRHILIDSDSVDIKNGNTVLSQFTDSTIYLGKNSTTSTIDFCNGNGYIFGRDDSTYGKGLWVDGGDRMYIVSNKELFINASSGGPNNDSYIHMEYSDSKSSLYIKSPKITIDGDTAILGNVTSNIRFGSTQLYIGPSGNDGANGVGGALNNLVLASWYGVSFTGTYGTYTGKTAVGIDCRSSIVYANTFNGTATNADKVDGKHANDIFAHKGLATCAQVGPNTRGCFNVNLTDTGMGWMNVIQFEQGHFLSQLGLPCWLDGSAKDLYIRSKYVGGGTAYDFANWNTGWKKLGIDVVIGTSATTLSYRSEFTKAVVEFWKTTVGSTSRTVYDSIILNGLSSSMGAQSPTAISSGPDFVFAIGNSSSGQIIISGNFTKYKITYFN